MVNEASFSVTGYVATAPTCGWTRSGTRSLFMRLAWTPRRIDKATGEWADQPTNFVSVICYSRVAENAAACLRRGDPVVVKGSLRVREQGDGNGPRRTVVEVIADAIGHDLSRGVTIFKKSTEQLEKTAVEREQQAAAGTREPLPGDRGSAERDSRGPGEGDPVPDEAELVPDEAELADGEEFDEEEARRVLAYAEAAAEPAWAAT